MSTKPKFRRGGRGLYCINMDKLIDEANGKGLSDLEISQKLGCAQSTVRNWYKTKNGDKKLAIKLYQLTNSIKSIEFIEPNQNEVEANESIDQTHKKEWIMEMDRIIKKGKFHKYCEYVDFTFSSGVLKIIILI